MSYTPLAGPILAGLLGDPEIAEHFTAAADLAAMTRFEAALARAESAFGVIPADAGEAIATACRSFAPDLDRIDAAVARDGVSVPEFVRQLRAHVGAPHGAHVHFGATSQDAIDTSLVLRLKPAVACFDRRLRAIDDRLGELDRRFGGAALLGRTRMQGAVPITVGDRIGSWRVPLQDHLARLDAIHPRLFRVQFGGAVGTLDRLGDKGPDVSRRLGAELGLGVPERPWHSDRSAVAEFAGWLSLLTGTLGKMGQDIVLMAQTGVGEIGLSEAGGSSAMPHKRNPVKGEVLVTLARFNAVQISGLHQALVHEQERSGAAWTLEWMLLPPMLLAAGAATRTALTLLGDVAWVGAPL